MIIERANYRNITQSCILTQGSIITKEGETKHFSFEWLFAGRDRIYKMNLPDCVAVWKVYQKL
jgi:hypothetical protein